MRANSSEPQDTVTAEQPITPTRLRLAGSVEQIPSAHRAGRYLAAVCNCADRLPTPAAANWISTPCTTRSWKCPSLRCSAHLRQTVVGFIILLGYEWSASPVCRGETARQDPGPRRVHGLCHRQRHWLVDALRRLGALPSICTSWHWRLGSRAHDRVRQPVPGHCTATVGGTGHPE